MNVQTFLAQVSGGQSSEDFVRDHPYHVLVEVEAQPGAPADDAAVTERLDSAFIRRQAASSREAQVFEVKTTDETPLLVGRAPQCGITLEHVSVSKEHARFTWVDGALMLEDLGSTNGTIVNNRRLQANTPTKVLPDDGVRFGKATSFHLMNPNGFFHYLGLLRRFGL